MVVFFKLLSVQNSELTKFLEIKNFKKKEEKQKEKEKETKKKKKNKKTKKRKKKKKKLQNPHLSTRLSRPENVATLGPSGDCMWLFAVARNPSGGFVTEWNSSAVKYS